MGNVEQEELQGKAGRSQAFTLGWVMVGVAAVAQYMSAPGQSYSVAAFKGPMRATLKIAETDFSLAYGAATIFSACMLPFVGRMIDRHGARRMLPVIGLGLGLACWGMSFTSSLPQLYAAFLGVRSIGQGALSLVSVWIVGEWFHHRRGIATALAGVGGGLSVMTVPHINHWLIQSYSWEWAWAVLGISVAATLVVPGWLVVRDRPEDVGLHPDGRLNAGEETSKGVPNTNGQQPESPTSESWTVSEVLRNPTFWRVLAVPATSGLVGTGIVFHQVSLIGRYGYSPEFALGLISLQAGFSMAMTFPIGWLTDRVPSRRLLAMAMICLASAVFILLQSPHRILLFAFALLLGLHGSILRSTAQVVWINFYGRENQGAVRGAAWSAMILSSAAGPLPLAWVWDTYRDYSPALYAFFLLPVAAAASVWSVRQPHRPSAEGAMGTDRSPNDAS